MDDDPLIHHQQIKDRTPSCASDHSPRLRGVGFLKLRGIGFLKLLGVGFLNHRLGGSLCLQYSLGGKPGAEALSGLARAFFYVDARSLIVSNWEVNSDSAVTLMIGTFAALAADPKL
jgi:hypothetical protein